jgi:hypothetical protein
MSSTAPSDSISNQGKKKNRPGKNARTARVIPTPSETNASFFSSQVQAAPIPQPGKYPIVFRTGAGEPTSDVEFCYDGDTLDGLATPFSSRYVYNPKYAEFSDAAGYTDELFAVDVQRQFYLGLAQQTVHAHVNMGLPLGDFSSIASSDVFLFNTIGQVVRQFGEFADPSLGDRFLLADYSTTVSSLVRAASRTSITNGRAARARKTVWLPTKAKDRRTTFIVAKRLQKLISTALGVRLSLEQLLEHLFDSHWDVFTALKPLLGDADARRDRFDFLFSSYSTEVHFVQKFSSARAQGVLRELGLWWDDPSQPDLSFDMIPKVEFPSLVDQWARKRAAIEKFFTCTSGLANRTAACGSHSQVSTVLTNAGITVVRTHVALAAPELSLLACFPPSCLFGDVGLLGVVVTTSVPLTVRATEFQQMDWKG